ncbi:phosphoserine phosphatase SerB [Acuticoccus sp. M5D2P5]|uniref:phosphoserine phosphatase SerB n=1 Tax=Acuticoccus kalidii TaxID=2910977 RepID=UPI001F1BE07B|nr:phosphoserine phosphatase SerB [Acuticoccus kalidii]MCF3933808.1 phosphoserine phosphatase SerB [Acuticoccus kalidii]
MTTAMELVITLVAPVSLDPTRVASFVKVFGADHAERLGDRATDIFVEADLAATREKVKTLVADEAFDAVVQPVASRAKKLLISDMDSTMIGQECIDELAAVHGLKPKVAAITERAMQGELDFADALRERVALLEGIPVASIEGLLARVITASPGAGTLIATCRAHGVRTVLVSGGFMQFAVPVAQRLGIDAAFANELIAADGVLTGRVAEPILGGDAKRERLFAECEAMGITPDDAIALGDGANDLPMLETAGLGLAYRAKPKVAAVADGLIRHSDLTTALFVMGIKADNFAADPSDHP